MYNGDLWVPGTTPPPSALGFSVYARSLNPVSYWRFGEAAGVVAKDELGLHDGTYTGAPTLGAASIIAHTTNTAVGLAGGAQLVSIPNPGSVGVFTGNTTWSIVAWANITPDITYRNIFETYNLAGNNVTLGYQSTTTYLRREANIGTPEAVFVAPLAPGIHMFAAVYVSNVMYFLIDGVQVGSVGSAGAMPNLDNTMLWGHEVIGTLDDSLIYKTNVYGEVATLYALGI